MTTEQPAATFGLDGLKLPSFKKPIPRDDVVSVWAFFGHGDTRAFIAENHSMSVQKVSAILSVPLPAEWRQQAEQLRKKW
ncbi:hypothetical protein ABGT16_05190 [Pseudomonas asiatica]|uniref:hypothetical protein n=1 Tax=Pseudomonas asiatica TaxID=2219225 RepID=UPI00345D2D96